MIWIRKNVNEDYPSSNLPEIDRQTAARILVDRAYEAGKFDAFPTAEEVGILSIEANIAACNDYQRGFEAGKAEGHICDEGCCESKWELGFEAAAKDPKAWYVLDKNGEPVHIGDKVKLTNNEVAIVQGLGLGAIFAVPKGKGYTIFETDYFEKVTPDTCEKIKDELSDIILYAMKSGEEFSGIDPDASANLNADEFISRILNAQENF